MSDKVEKKKETKKQLRALLLSAPAALTISELKRDYYDFTNSSIPYRELGFTTVEDMFKEMDDAFQISWKNGVMCLQAVSQQETAHIQKLVSKQKVSNKNKYATLRRGGPSKAPRFRSNQNNNFHSRQYQRPPPTVPAFIRKQLFQLMKAYNSGLPLTHFDNAFARRFGVQLDFYRLGFKSTYELLGSVPDIIRLQEYQGGEMRVIPANYTPDPEPIRRQNQGHEGNWREKQYDTYSYESANPPREFRGINSQYQNITTNHRSTQEAQTSGQHHERMQTQISVESTDKPTVVRGRGRRRTADKTDEARSVGRDSLSSSTSLESPGLACDESGIHETLQINIRKILEEHGQQGVWASRLPFFYLKKFDKELNYREEGYVSMIEMCGALPELISIERPLPKGDWLLFDARIPRPETPPHTAHKEVSEKPYKGKYSGRQEIDADLKEKIRQVLLCRPQGVLLTELPNLYKKLVGEELPWRELGYKNIQLFMISLADTSVNLQYKGNGCMLVFAIDDGRPIRTDLLKNYAEQEASMKKCPDIPTDAIGAKVYYRPQPLPPLNEHIKMSVSNVVSPGIFWVQLRGKTTHKALDKVMNDIEKIYCSAEGDSYKVPDYLVVVGQIVAAVFPEDSNWHRCVITALSVGKYVEVYFVDFGNTCNVHRDQIRLLKSCFIKLPAQALQARLAYVEPFDGKNWTINARNRLLELVMNRPLYALVSFEKDRILSVMLVDTSTNVDVCYNDLLVNEGYARFNPDAMNTNFSGTANQKDVPNYDHVYGGEDEQEIAPAVQEVQHSPEVTAPARRYGQPIQLTAEYVVTLINWEGEAYLPSAEVSAFFFEDDIITMLLKQVGKSAESVTLNLKEHPDLFEDLKLCDVMGSSDSKTITLYKLSGVPNILEWFEHKSDELHANVKELLQMFDPLDPYWRGEDDTESVNSQDVAESALDLEEIDIYLQICQFKRKRLLKSMITNPENNEDDVNELNDVEKQITRLKTMQEDVRKQKALAPISPEKGQFTNARSHELSPPSKTSTIIKTPDITGMSSSTATTPIKMNIVAPMQSQAPKPTSSTMKQADAMSAAERANKEMLENMAKAQQQLLQNLLLQNQLSSSQTPATNQLQFSQQFNQLPLNQQLGQSTGAINPQLGQTPSTVNHQLNQSAGALNPQMMALMQQSMMPPFMSVPPFVPGLPQQPNTGLSQDFNLQNFLPGQSSEGLRLPNPSSLQQQTLPTGNMLLPGLLPLLNTLNINQDSSDTSRNNQS